VAYLRNIKFIKLVGERIRLLRLEQNRTQEDVAFEIGIEPVQLSRIENGKINTSISHICEIAKCLKISPKDIFAFGEDEDF
jgi:transcriptional regulator with XRE-family HTH domain